MNKKWLCCLIVGAAALPAWAELADRDKPMFIEADTMRYDDANKITNATGNVVATKGTLVLRSDAVEVRQDAAGKNFVVATAQAGKQAFMRQKREGLNQFFEAQANRIERDENAQVARLIGKAVMRRLEGDVQVDEVRGDVIVYNEVTEVYNVTGGAKTGTGADGVPSGRVRAVLGNNRMTSRANSTLSAASPSSGTSSKGKPASKSVPLQSSEHIGTAR